MRSAVLFLLTDSQKIALHHGVLFGTKDVVEDKKRPSARKIHSVPVKHAGAVCGMPHTSSATELNRRPAREPVRFFGAALRPLRRAPKAGARTRLAAFLAAKL